MAWKQLSKLSMVAAQKACRCPGLFCFDLKEGTRCNWSFQDRFCSLPRKFVGSFWFDRLLSTESQPISSCWLPFCWGVRTESISIVLIGPVPKPWSFSMTQTARKSSPILVWCSLGSSTQFWAVLGFNKVTCFIQFVQQASLVPKLSLSSPCLSCRCSLSTRSTDFGFSASCLTVKTSHPSAKTRARA